MVEKIKLLCQAEGISIAALEKKLEIGNGTISRWDESSPSISKVSAVAKYFGITIDSLLVDHTQEQAHNTEVSFYDTFFSLCQSVGKSPSKVAMEIGLSKSCVSRWKVGHSATDLNLQKIANYFGCEVQDLNSLERRSNQSNIFYNNFLKLCAQKQTTPVDVVSEIGISKSNITYWKNGRNLPSDNTLSKLSAFFNVSVEDFFKEKNLLCTENSVSDNTESLDKITRQLIDLVYSLDYDNRVLLLKIANCVKEMQKR